MRHLTHKVRYGVMELRTDVGVAYARPSFWQRVYMLWTFRNFHRLPKEVLNKRQLRVIHKFCWSAMTRHELTIRNSVIGSIENVRLMRAPRLAVQSIATRVPEVSIANTEVALPRAAGAEPISAPSIPLAHNQVSFANTEVPLPRAAGWENISAPSIPARHNPASLTNPEVSLPRAAGAESVSALSSPAAHNQVSLGDVGRRNNNVWSISASRPAPLEETGAEAAFARTAAWEEISVPSSPPAHNQVSLGNVGRDSSDIWSEPTPPPAEKTERAPEKEDENPAAELFQLEMYRDSGRQLVQNRLAWVLAGAFGTLLLVGSFSYFRDSQQEDIGPQEDGVIYQQPASAIIPPATTNQPEKVEQSAPAPLKPPVTDPGPKSQITISAPVSAGPNPAAPKPEAGLAREAPVVNRVPKFQSVTSEPTPAISNPVPKSEFANSAPPATVKNPVLDPESTSSTVTPPSPAESRPPSEKLSRTAVPRRRSVTIGPIPEGIPRIAETPQPGFRYPVVSNRALRGKVSLKAMVGIDGSVKQLSVLDGNPALVAAAVRAVRHWRYRPYEIAGQAIEVQTNVTFNFLGHDVVTISFPAEP